MPEPRVLVLQDADHSPGFGALVGEIHATIAQALDCVGCVTDGAVRDLEAVAALRFPLFSRRVSVSHAFAHIVDFGDPVEIGQVVFAPGDLVHGDRNGVHIIPAEVAERVPAMVEKIQAQESELTQFCRSGGFSLQELGGMIKQVSKDGMPPNTPVTNTAHTK